MNQTVDYGSAGQIPLQNVKANNFIKSNDTEKRRLQFGGQDASFLDLSGPNFTSSNNGTTMSFGKQQPHSVRNGASSQYKYLINKQNASGGPGLRNNTYSLSTQQRLQDAQRHQDSNMLPSVSAVQNKFATASNGQKTIPVKNIEKMLNRSSAMRIKSANPHAATFR